MCYESAFNTADNILIYIAEDTNNDRRGIAYRKNECLKALKDCDYIFLVDDDIVFLKKEWERFFIEESKASEQQHLLYLKDTSSIKLIKATFFPPANTCIEQYSNCGGCFVFVTKEVIEKVGAFDERFGKYGWEHANYSKRIHMAGLTPMGEYLCPEKAGEYIYAMDYDNYLPFNKQVNHRPSLPVKDALAEINKGAEHWQKPITEIFIPL